MKNKNIIKSQIEVIEKDDKIMIDKETIYKEEFEMLYNGATVEEVEQAIDKKEQEKREYQEKAKQQALEEHKARDIRSRIETAEALAKAGVISKQDFEKIKAEAEKEIENKQPKEESQSEPTAKVDNDENSSNEDKKEQVCLKQFVLFLADLKLLDFNLKKVQNDARNKILSINLF